MPAVCVRDAPASQITVPSFLARKALFAASLTLAATGIALAPLAAGQDAVAANQIVFDIPAQPLASALERFMAITNIAVVADSIVIAQSSSRGLKGRFPPDIALRALLAGTGLDPRPIGDGAYTLVARPWMSAAPQTPPFAEYAAAIQQAVTAALCRNEDTRPTHYRTVLRLWFDPDGVVTRVELARSAGSDRLNAAIGDALRHLAIGMPIPPGLRQPVKLAVVPHLASDEECGPTSDTAD